MTTHRQQSFIATVSSEFGTLGHFSQLHSERFVNPFAGFSWTRFQIPFASHLLGHVSESRSIEPLHWYFRYTDSGFVLFTRSQHYFGRFIGYSRGSFGAFSTSSEVRSKYRFEPVEGQEHRDGEEVEEGDEIITRIISMDTGKPLCLRNAQFKHRVRKRWEQKLCTYIAADGGKPLHLRLKFIQANAPYLDNPDEV